MEAVYRTGMFLVLGFMVFVFWNRSVWMLICQGNSVVQRRRVTVSFTMWVEWRDDKVTLAREVNGG